MTAAEVPAGSGSGPATGGSTAPPAPGEAAEESSNSTPRREPQVNQVPLQQVRGQEGSGGAKGSCGGVKGSVAVDQFAFLDSINFGTVSS